MKIRQALCLAVVVMLHVAAAVAVPIVSTYTGREGVAGILVLWGLGAAGLVFLMSTGNYKGDI